MIKVGDFALMPPRPEVCQACATDHEPDQPHNQQSLFWQYWFYSNNGRWPTWADAMEHCSAETRAAWIDGLRQYGLEVT